MQSIYEIDVEHHVHDFLITDRKLADFLSQTDRLRDNDERLLIAEYDGGLDLSLYIDEEVINHMDNAHPVELIEQGKYSEFCLMLEGVSHFVYLIWRAKHQKKITLLEMELQAEIDKFILLQSFYDADRINNEFIRNWLFERHEFDALLNAEERERYECANHYAGKYCMGLQQQYSLSGLNNTLLNELRRFYRLGQEQKFRYINSLH